MAVCSQEELGTPALALVRAVCAVYCLDAALEDEVSVMRRQLLRLVHTAEFSPASEWRDPCRSFVLRDVVCRRCSDCRDLDLCRDPGLLAHTYEQGHAYLSGCQLPA